ncbi:branched-chain amino acid transport system II carrier protein [Streptococcus fryi]
MKKSQSLTSMYLIVGLMLFALFFGAGNLIYPALLGLYSGSNLWLAVLGFCLTAVTLPLLGVVAIAYTGSEDAESIARPVSKLYAIFFSVALYLSIGPFFAIPRTGATSYSIGIEPVFGSSFLVKVLYAIIFFGLSYFLAIKPSKMADRIGKYLTPTLLLVIAILVIASFVNPADSLGTPLNAKASIDNAFADVPFVAGLIQGYGTMDALASLAFAIVVINSAKSFGAKSNAEIAGITVKSGVIATLLLALIYIFVSRIGATSQALFNLTDGQFMLNGNAVDGGTILSKASHYYLGTVGQVILSVVIFLACLTTSTGLISACAEYFHKLVPKVSYIVWATAFTLIATTLYFGGLSEIINWSVPVLFLLYPLTVVIIVLALSHKFFNNDGIVYKTTIGLTFIASLYDAISTFAAMTQFFVIPDNIKNFFSNIVPLGAYSMGWITFATVGFILGLILHKLKK